MYLQELFFKENSALDELTHYKTLPAYQAARDSFAGVGRTGHYNAMKKFHAFMQENGFTRLGKGAFGEVYEKEGYPWVFKLFHGDPAYLDFLNYAIAHQGNPHLPKIKGKPFKIDDKTYAVRMEKLYPWTEKFEVNAGDNMSLADTLRWWRPPVTPNQETFLKSHNAAGLIPVLNQLAELCRSKNYGLDIHSGNIMRRGTHLVIIDPLVDYDSIQHSYASHPNAGATGHTIKPTV